MPREETRNSFFRSQWKHISLASWQKYPCSERPDVICVDLLNKDFDPETGILRATRVMAMEKQLPGWLKMIVGNSTRTYFLEESIVDPNNEIMILKGSNISFKNLFQLEETCKYKPQISTDGSAEWTQFSQTAKTHAHVWGVGKKMEEWSVNSFIKDAKKGQAIMENTIQKVKAALQEFNIELNAKAPTILNTPLCEEKTEEDQEQEKADQQKNQQQKKTDA